LIRPPYWDLLTRDCFHYHREISLPEIISNNRDDSLYTRSFLLSQRNPLLPEIILTKFGSNCPSSFGEEDQNVKRLQMTDNEDDSGCTVMTTYSSHEPLRLVS